MIVNNHSYYLLKILLCYNLTIKYTKEIIWKKNTLLNLFNKYKEQPNLENQDLIYKYYKKNVNDREEIVKEISDFLRSDLPKPSVEWSFIFESNKKMRDIVYLIEMEKEAKKSYNMNIGNTLIDFCVDMFLTFHRQSKELGLENQVEKIWLNVFKDNPNFEKAVKLGKIKQEERLAEILSEIKNTYIKEEKQTIKKLEFNTPLVYYVDGQKIENIDENIKNNIDYINHIQDMENFFNDFDLINCLNIDNYKNINSIQIKYNNNYCTLLIELNADLDTDLLRNELLGQLSDGIGSNLSQNVLLIDDKEYLVDFDIKNSSNIYEIKNKKIKP